jgi:hypothetical protein
MSGLAARALAASVLAAVALGLIGGCGEDEGEAPDSPSPPSDGPLVEYSRTGGIAGIDERLRIEADGAATYAVGAPEPRRRSFALSETELEELNGLLDEVALDALEPMDSGCADCFVYTVAHAGETAALDDVTLLDAPGSVQQLIGFLNALAADAAR